MPRIVKFFVRAMLLSLFSSESYAEPFLSEYSILHEKPKFKEVTGEQIFDSICKGCHMSDAAGAKGAGYYPALAHDQKLYAAAYPIYVVVEGMGNMPAFKDYLSDEQIQNVVNYIRTNFGNDAKGDVSIEAVKAISKR